MKLVMPTELTDVNELTYPVQVSPLFDGTRVQIVNGQPIDVVNKMVKDILSGLPNFDGVLVGEGFDEPDEVPSFVFYVHDIVTRTGTPFNQRLELVRQFVEACGNNIRAAPYRMIKSPEGLMAVLEAYGKVMIRDPATLGGEFYYMEWKHETQEQGFSASLASDVIGPSDSEVEVEQTDVR